MENFRKYYSRLKAGICFEQQTNTDVLEMWVCNELEPYEYLIKLNKAELEVYSQRALAIENWSPAELGIVRVYEGYTNKKEEASYLLDVAHNSKYYGLWIYESELNSAKVPKGDESLLIEAINLSNEKVTE
jgi:hypothetical protein